MQAAACRTVTISQFLFTTRFANWHLSLPNKSNLAFFKGVWQWKLSFGIKWWNASRNHVCNLIENRVGDFKALYRQNGKSYKKTSTETAHPQTFRYKMECISRTENTCRNLQLCHRRWSLPFTYQNLGNFRGFYSQNGKLHKKVNSTWAHHRPFSNRWKA